MESCFTRTLHDHNDLLVTGAVFLSEKANNMRSTFKTTPLDISLGVHTADQVEVSNKTIGYEKIGGIMVGDGGAGDTYNTVYKVNRAALSVPGPVPFRVVPVENDLKDTDREKYFLRVVRVTMPITMVRSLISSLRLVLCLKMVR